MFVHAQLVLQRQVLVTCPHKRYHSLCWSNHGPLAERSSCAALSANPRAQRTYRWLVVTWAWAMGSWMEKAPATRTL
jgi:hypothetical protein